MNEDKGYNDPSEIENNKSKWNLESDLKLLNALKFATDEISRKIQNNATCFDDLIYKSKVCKDKINNLTTNVLILTNSKFIENRVYDEDIKEIAHVKTSLKRNEQINSEQAVIERLRNSITYGINCLTQKYKLSSDEVQNFDKTKFLSDIYIHKNQFVNKPLPFLIGSDNFTKDTFVGLKFDNDNSFIVLNKTSNDLEEENHFVVNNFQPTEDKIHFSDELKTTYPEKQNGYLNAHENIFSPIHNEILTDEDEDIFSEPIITDKLLNKNEQSKNLISEIKDTVISKQKDFFNSDLEEESEDDLFQKKPIRSKEHDIKDNIKEKITTDDDLFKQSNLTSLETKADNLFNSTIATEPKKIIPIKSTLDSIFSSDDEDAVDIFNVKISNEKTNSVKEKIFSIDSSDDDDFFTPLNRKNKSLVETKSNNFPVASQDSFSISQSNQRFKEPSTSISSKVPFMPNVISELSSAIKNKKIEIDDSSNDNSEDNDSEQEKTNDDFAKNEESYQKAFTSNSVQPFLNSFDKTNSFNNILKHKAKVNSKRNRKVPTRFSKFKPIPSNSDEIIASEIINERIEPISEITNEPLHVNDSLFKNDNQSQSLFSSSDENDLFSPTNTKKEQNPIKTNPIFPPVPITSKEKHDTQTIKTNKKEVSIFDSSEDSDTDIFSKAIVKTKTEKEIATVSSSIFSDSDDDDFIHSNFSKITVENKSKSNQLNKINENALKCTNIKKSIFDDDDDSDDDLFK